MEGNLIDGNTAGGANATVTTGGGGIAMRNASPTVRGNDIRANAAPNTPNSAWGGGIHVYGGAPSLSGNTISGNSAYYAGGIMADTTNAGIFGNNIIANNGGTFGGGIYLAHGTANVRDNVIARNGAFAVVGSNGGGGGGGGIYGYQTTGIIASNTVVYNAGPLGAIYTVGSSGSLANNVVAFNEAGVSYLQYKSAPLLRANDVYGNTVFNYTGVQDPTGANGNISVDPLLADPAGGNFHIQPASACRDAGDASVPLPGETDVDGQPRVQGAGVDIGADESDGTVWSASSPVVRVGPNGDDANDGHTWAAAKKTIHAALGALPFGGDVWVARGTYGDAVTVGSNRRLLGVSRVRRRSPTSGTPH